MWDHIIIYLFIFNLFQKLTLLIKKFLKLSITPHYVINYWILNDNMYFPINKEGIEISWSHVKMAGDTKRDKRVISDWEHRYL